MRRVATAVTYREPRLVRGVLIKVVKMISEEELEELRAKIDQIIRYIPSHRFSLCIPNAEVLPSESYEAAEEKQWHTLKMAEMVAGELWPEEG